MKRVLMVEPLGEGGICQYTYCLSQALSERDCDVTLATGRPYELAFAEPRFEVGSYFAPGQIRDLVQHLLRRSHPRGGAASSGGVDQDAERKRVSPDAPRSPRPLTGIGAHASRWLGLQEYRAGWRRTLAVAERTRPSVAHIQWLSNPERDLQWLRRLRALGMRVVVTAHNVLPHDAPASARDVWKRIYDLADALIVHYPAAVDDLRALGVDSERVSVIPLGNYLPIAAHTSGAEREQWSQEQARESLGLAHDAPIALFFGMMRPYKGIEYLLDAFARVHAELPHARLLMVGAAPAGFQRFERHIHQLGISGVVTAMPRYAPLSAVGPWFRAADLVVLPYIEASQSAVTQLAYAFSRPVIVTHVGGLADAVEDDVTGLVVPPRDSAALAEALLAMLGNRERCALWGERAYTTARDRLSWGPIAERTIAVYERAGVSPPS